MGYTQEDKVSVGSDNSYFGGNYTDMRDSSWTGFHIPNPTNYFNFNSWMRAENTTVSEPYQAFVTDIGGSSWDDDARFKRKRDTMLQEYLIDGGIGPSSMDSADYHDGAARAFPHPQFINFLEGFSQRIGDIGGNGFVWDEYANLLTETGSYHTNAGSNESLDQAWMGYRDDQPSHVQNPLPEYSSGAHQSMFQTPVNKPGAYANWPNTMWDNYAENETFGDFNYQNPVRPGWGCSSEEFYGRVYRRNIHWPSVFFQANLTNQAAMSYDKFRRLISARTNGVGEFLNMFLALPNTAGGAQDTDEVAFSTNVYGREAYFTESANINNNHIPNGIHPPGRDNPATFNQRDNFRDALNYFYHPDNYTEWESFNAGSYFNGEEREIAFTPYVYSDTGYNAQPFPHDELVANKIWKYWPDPYYGEYDNTSQNWVSDGSLSGGYVYWSTNSGMASQSDKWMSTIEMQCAVVNLDLPGAYEMQWGRQGGYGVHHYSHFDYGGWKGQALAAIRFYS